MTTLDQPNVDLFGRMAADWWDPRGSSRVLHAINPVRLRYVRDQAARQLGAGQGSAPLAGVTALDLGCGGGLASEGLARMGAAVTGLDAAAPSIAVARAHGEAAGLTIEYRLSTAEALAAERPGEFDLITCFEVIEHIPARGPFLAAVATLLRPGGLLVLSTPNRTAASWAVVIAGAERITGTLPRGSHSWRQFVRPGELTAELANTGFTVRDMQGLTWRPLSGWQLGTDQRINYFGAAVKA